MPRLIFADQDLDRRHQICRHYRASATVLECGTVHELIQLLASHRPSLVMISLPANQAEALEAVHHVRGAHPSAHVILVVDHSSEAIAIEAFRAGVSEFLPPPVSMADIIETIDRFVPPTDADDDCRELAGESGAIQEIKESIRRLAPMNSTVLITGETGTGKEVVARLMHRLSSRARAPMISVNCAALPDTLLESELFGHETGAFTGAVRRHTGQIQMANGGTLFLDEIGDMSMAAQAKLLRVIEEREIRPLGSSNSTKVDIRLIAATHCRLEQMVSEAKFRGDLFYRVNVAHIHLPPLRKRLEDLPTLARQFLAQLCGDRQIHDLSDSAMRRLMTHNWPGNVRELHNVIEAATVSCRSRVIDANDLPWMWDSRTLPMADRESSTVLPPLPQGPEIDRLMEALRLTNWNVTKTARMLQWSRMTVYRKAAKYGVERPSGEDNPALDAGEFDHEVEQAARAANEY